MEKIKKFASDHWRILLVCTLTLVSMLLIMSVVLQMKGSNKSKKSEKTETSGKYPISSVVKDGTVLEMTVDGSLTPDHKWVLSPYTEEYISLEVNEEKSNKISFVATAKAEGVTTLHLERVKENDENVISAILELNIIVDEAEDGTITIAKGTDNLRVMKNDMVLGEGTSSEGRVDLVGGSLSAVFTSKLEDIKCVASNADLVEIVDPLVEFVETEGEDTGKFIETMDGTKIPVILTYRDAATTSIRAYAKSDGDVTLTFSSPGIDLEAMRSEIDDAKAINIEGITENEKKEFEEMLAEDEIIQAMEERYNYEKERQDRNGADAYKGFSYTLNLHIEGGNIYIVE